MNSLLNQPIKNQKGDMLLEALISIVLMAIVAVGITFALSRVAVNLRDTKVHVSVVNDLRQILLNIPHADLCTGSGKYMATINGDNVEITVQNCNERLAIEVDGDAVTLVPEINAPLVLQWDGYSVGGEVIEAGS